MKYNIYSVQFYPNGILRKLRTCKEESAIGNFYNNEYGFGGVVQAKTEDEAIKLVKEQIHNKRM